MDSTHAEIRKSPVSKATLVTSIGLGSANFGFIAGIFGSVAGELSRYEATGVGATAATVAFGIGMSIATFIRKDSGT